MTDQRAKREKNKKQFILFVACSECRAGCLLNGPRSHPLLKSWSSSVHWTSTCSWLSSCSALPHVMVKSFMSLSACRKASMVSAVIWIITPSKIDATMTSCELLRHKCTHCIFVPPFSSRAINGCKVHQRLCLLSHMRAVPVIGHIEAPQNNFKIYLLQC